MKLKNKNIQISCDGGAATGKSTGAKMISKKYNLKFLSSGLLYRYAAYQIIKNQPKNKILFLKKVFKNLNYNRITKIHLHTQKISNYSAKIAKSKKIRVVLKRFQIQFAKKYASCCIEGRDISTKILPRSDIKFFFICSLKIAALRRYNELKKKFPYLKLTDVKKSLKIRNLLDINRKNSPLLKHRDSIVIDTGNLNKQAMLAKMSKHVERFLNKKHGNRSNN
jgi:cytidylate kinase